MTSLIVAGGTRMAISSLWLLRVRGSRLPRWKLSPARAIAQSLTKSLKQIEPQRR
jgi:hypothetical protein